jgi:SAM-dependent methyltransferase
MERFGWPLAEVQVRMTTANLNPANDQAGDTAPAWRQFWSTGAVDTFGSSLAAVMAPESDASPPLVRHWRQWLRELPGEGELLDIGTGNGVVLSHLLAARPESAWRGLGVDLTQPHPAWLGTLAPDLSERIEVRGEVAAERLPFESGRFAAVTSQFGIEYADLDQAVPEAARVLRPGGALGWAVHHAHGRPAGLAREELAHHQWLEQVKWLDTVLQALHGLGATLPGQPPQATAVSAGAAGVRSELDRLGHALRTRAQDSSCPDLLQDVGRLTVQCLGLAHRQEATRAVPLLMQFHRALAENRTRLEDLVAHALDDAAWAQLLDQVQAQGIRLAGDTGPLSDRGHLMGWWLHGTRA